MPQLARTRYLRSGRIGKGLGSGRSLDVAHDPLARHEAIEAVEGDDDLEDQRVGARCRVVGPHPGRPHATADLDHVPREVDPRERGRADLSWEESIRLDLRYVDNWSFAFDLQILWKTGRAVLSGSGAY